MEHISEIELIEYVADRLRASRHEEVREHITACEECSGRWRGAVETWNALGQWNVDTADHDVAGRIIALAEKAESNRKQLRLPRILRVGLLPTALRVAASIIIAIGVGHKLGKYSVTGSMPSVPPSTNRPEYLAALGLEWSSELAWLMLEDESPNGGNL